MYCYQASLALVFASFIFWAGLLWYGEERKESLLYFWLSFLVISSPFTLKFLPHFNDYLRTGHYAHQFILNPEVNHGRLLPVLGKQVLEHLALYGFAGDGRWRHNLPNRPFFDPWLAIFFWAGIIIALLRIQELPYSFALLNLVAMLLPGLLAYNNAGPHFLHISGAFVPSCLFPAIAMKWAMNAFRSKRWLFTAMGLIILALLGLEGYWTFNDYFNIWAKKVSETMSFDELFVKTAEILNSYSPQPDLWVLPNSAVQKIPLVPSSFTFIYTNSTPYSFIPADEAEAPERLREILKGHKTAGLVEWDLDSLKWAAPVYGDRKGLLRFLLEQVGTLKERKVFDSIALSLYELPESFDFTLYPESCAGIRFGEIMEIKGCEFGGTGSQATVPSGGVLWAILRWEAIRPPGQNYKAALYITDNAGHLIAQDDRLLLNEKGLPTASWQAGSQGLDYRLISIPPGTPPGEYSVEVAVYNPESLLKLPVTSGPKVSARIARTGKFTVARSNASLSPSVKVNAYIGEPPSLLWLGFEPIPKELKPGDKFTLNFHWQALQDAPPKAEVKIELVNREGEVVQESYFPVGLSYPTALWIEGETVTDRYDLILARKVPSGNYDLVTEVKQESSGLRYKLGTIQVKSWPRMFEMPPVGNRAEIKFDSLFQLEGYEISDLKPGESAQIKLCWRALEEIPDSYKIFIHLVNQEGAIVSQVDAVPCYGECPTTGWLPGEYICTAFALPTPADLPEGNYALVSGAYDSLREERLPLYDGTNRYVGDGFRVVGFKIAK